MCNCTSEDAPTELGFSRVRQYHCPKSATADLDGAGPESTLILAGEEISSPSSRPSACARRDPYAVPSRFGTRSVAFRYHHGRWLWVPAFAGTTAEDLLHYGGYGFWTRSFHSRAGM